MIAKVFTVETLEFFVFFGSHSKRGSVDFVGKDNVLDSALYSAVIPLVGKSVANGDAPFAFGDPVFGISFRFVHRTHAADGELWVIDFLDPLISDLCQPPFERFGLGGRDRLDDAEDRFGISAVGEIFLTIRRREFQLYDFFVQLNGCSFFRKFYFEIGPISSRYGTFRQRADDVDHRKIPAAFIPDAANFLLFEKGESGRHSKALRNPASLRDEIPGPKKNLGNHSRYSQTNSPTSAFSHILERFRKNCAISSKILPASGGALRRQYLRGFRNTLPRRSR